MVKGVVLLVFVSLWSTSVQAVVTGKPDSRTEVLDSSDEMSDDSRGLETAELNTDTGELKRLLEAGNDILPVDGKEELDGKGKVTSPLSLILLELSELKEAMNGLKTQNNIIFKQMKAYHKSCSATGIASSSSPASSFLSPASVARPDTMASIPNAILSGKSYELLSDMHRSEVMTNLLVN